MIVNMYHKIMVVKPDYKWVILEVQDDSDLSREVFIASYRNGPAAARKAHEIAREKGLEVVIIK